MMHEIKTKLLALLTKMDSRLLFAAGVIMTLIGIADIASGNYVIAIIMLVVGLVTIVDAEVDAISIRTWAKNKLAGK